MTAPSAPNIVDPASTLRKMSSGCTRTAEPWIRGVMKFPSS